jgi:5-hydroxyisourate hydrolase-like protein (transthyretin family)
MKPALLGFLFCATLAAQPASLEGAVVNQATGQPLAGVHVHLVTGDFSDSGADQIVYGAISDRAGHFSVTNMKPGIYVVIPERAGFVHVPSAKPVTFVPLKPGQQLAGCKLEMTPRATISGRVVDEYGDPVQHVAVQLAPVAGGAQIDPFIEPQSGSTNDRGEFHLVAAPGRYYLKASDFFSHHEAAPEIRTDGTSAAPYVATYYPSAATTSAASVVQTAPGQDIAGLEIRLSRQPAAGAESALTIGGIVTGAPDNAMVSVFLQHGESPGQMFDSQGANARPDGKFVFRGLQPGPYRLSAHYSSGKTYLVSQPVDLTLGSSDQTNLQLVLAPAEEIAGTLEITGDAPPAAPAEKRTVRLDPAYPFDNSGNPETTPGDVDPKGAFRIGNVAPGRFVPVVDPLPENAYIQSVTLDNTPAPDNILDLSRGLKGSRIKITVSRNGAQVSGTVLDKDGQPLVSPLVMIFLVTDPKQLQEMQPDNQHRVTEGKYTIKAIRPGKYRLFALDILTLATDSPDANSDDDELMKMLFNSAEEIQIKPGDRIVKDLKAIDKLPGKEPPHAAQDH